ncbi:hypothetical protein PR202_ga24117 [Eleusine coracana subsp. coracana]|uniref:Uncharacterized protein n=1 Tax=Eleusine coracana subsp. coracana TaxID=191504 RepID=A0AAV5D805_ELECO|nr:hypothetical protein PR202_ga24117 [Eleusine coracana subsp. coracana]
MDEAAHRQWHKQFLPTTLTAAGEPRLLRSYRFIFNGFAARLTDAELEAVAKKLGFLRSFPDRVRELLTTHTPKFLGLSRDAGVWQDTSYGKGVVIGVIDTGINGGHPSVDNHGIASPPAKWKGSCQGSVRCNHKLVGAKSFLDGGNYDPSDHDGHGTHTATTAAGNFVVTYKACDGHNCNDSAILRAMDAAVDDGVDVMSISIGAGVAHRHWRVHRRVQAYRCRGFGGQRRTAGGVCQK